MEPCIIFNTLNMAKTIAKYFGVVETVDSDIKKLLHQQYIAAQNSLRNAQTATHNMRAEYLKSALNSFNQAIAIEENENLISSYVGMAMCQYLLGDVNNAKISLQNASKVELENTEIWLYRAKNVGKNCFKRAVSFYESICNDEQNTQQSIEEIDWDGRERIFEDYKKKAISVLLKK